MSTTTGEIVDELKGTAGEKLLRADPEARVVVNFHGVSRTISIIPPIVLPSSRKSTSWICLQHVGFFLQTSLVCCFRIGTYNI